MLLNIYLLTVGVIGIMMIAGGLRECLPRHKSRPSRHSWNANRGLLPV